MEVHAPLRVMSLHALAYCERLFYHCVARFRDRDGGDTWAEESDLVII